MWYLSARGLITVPPGLLSNFREEAESPCNVEIEQMTLTAMFRCISRRFPDHGTARLGLSPHGRYQTCRLLVGHCAGVGDGWTIDRMRCGAFGAEWCKFVPLTNATGKHTQKASQHAFNTSHSDLTRSKMAMHMTTNTAHKRRRELSHAPRRNRSDVNSHPH